MTADRYSRIAAALRTKGRPIPTNDAWIAAHAMETGADLVSADEHFAHVDWDRLGARADGVSPDGGRGGGALSCRWGRWRRRWGWLDA